MSQLNTNQKPSSDKGASSSLSFVQKLFGNGKEVAGGVSIQSPSVLKMKWKNVFSSTPETEIIVDKGMYDSAKQTAETTAKLADQLKVISDKIIKTKTIDKVTSIVDHMKTVADKLFGGEVGGVAAGYSAFEMIMEVTVCIESVLGVIAKQLTPMSVITCLYSLFKLIVTIMRKLPVVYNYVLNKFKEFMGVNEFKDTTEEEEQLQMEELGGEGNHFVNLAYSALIFAMPRKVQYFLDLYQRYTRIRILEDVDWLTSISEILAAVPSYTMDLFASTLWLAGFQTAGDTVHNWVQYYDSHLNFMPRMMTMRYAALLEEYVSELQVDRSRVMNVTDLSKYQELVTKVRAHLTKLEGHGIKPDVGFVNLFTTLSNYVRNAQYMAQKSHPEPVSILLYGKPGAGKTFFVQQVRQYLTRFGKNSIYDYNPTDGSSDFHDRYDNHNWWIHEDIGRRGAMDWGPYIPMIAVNPCRLDGAALDKKSTLFFNSQVVLGTTNTNLCAENLKWEKNCGWVEPNAVKRRWIVVNYSTVTEADGTRHGAKNCKAYKLNVDTGVWRLYDKAFDCSSAEVFVERIKKMYQEKVKEFDKFILSLNSDKGANYSFGDLKAEGRTKVVNIETPTVEIEDPEDLPFVYASRIQQVEMPDGTIKEIDINPVEQQKYLDQGYLINGGTDIVGEGPVHIGNKESWSEWLKRKWIEFQQNAMDGLNYLLTGYQRTWECFRTLPPAFQVGVGVFAALGLVGVCTANYFFLTKQQEHEFLPFVAYGKSMKRQTAKELFAEGFKLDLDFQLPPTEAIKAIQKNILKCCISYDVYHCYGFAVAINANTIIMNAHFLMYGNKPAEEVFIKGEDSTGRELVSAFFKVVRMDLEEDVAILEYRGAHAQLFRSLKKSMLKDPSSKDMYLVCSEGVLPIGSPTRAEVTSGLYRVGRRAYSFKNGIAHHYDGKAEGALGLCGSLAVTLDGYIVGWHVAGNAKGTGYVRFWNKELKDFVLGIEETTAIPIKENSDIKGAIELEEPIPRYVSLKSGIVPSAMLTPMLKSKILCPDGMPLRAPAELGGKVQLENGEVIGTYDRSRKKNLGVSENPVNMAALKFARKVIHARLDKILGGKKIPVLTEEEVVSGFKDERGVLNGLNKDASAGHPLNGLVKDHIHGKRLSQKVLDMMSEVERLAVKNTKLYSSVVFTDQNKDEVRDYEKRQKPRCFAAGPLHYTALIRKYFGSLCAMTMKSRMDHGIMIGINATSPEWSLMWNKLRMWLNHFDGDYEIWDGGMRREFQEELNEELGDWSPFKQIATFILSFLYETTRIGKDLSYLTTHSVPSGHGITALYNSLINEMYLAYAWYILVGSKMPGTDDEKVQQFFMDIFAIIYGDDLAVGVAERIKMLFNAVTYSAVMRDLGLGFTTAGKKQHTKPFVPLRDITFLKRSFFAHRLINDIVGPLNLNVLKASAGFVHDGARDEEITRQKMNSLQRELFLHSPETYQVVWGELKSCFKEAFNVDYTGLSESELRQLYWSGDLRSDLFEMYGEGGSGGLPSHRKNKKTCMWHEPTPSGFN